MELKKCRMRKKDLIQNNKLIIYKNWSSRSTEGERKNKYKIILE